MSNAMHTRWGDLLTNLMTQAHELADVDEEDAMIQQLEHLLQTCPFRDIETRLWSLRDYVAGSLRQHPS
jgi:hypothetical protein